MHLGRTCETEPIRMARRRSPKNADRYKQAATAALTLLDWCIEYFASNGRERIARQLARRRNAVHKRLEDKP